MFPGEYELQEAVGKGWLGNDTARGVVWKSGGGVDQRPALFRKSPMASATCWRPLRASCSQGNGAVSELAGLTLNSVCLPVIKIQQAPKQNSKCFLVR